MVIVYGSGSICDAATATENGRRPRQWSKSLQRDQMTRSVVEMRCLRVRCDVCESFNVVVMMESARSTAHRLCPAIVASALRHPSHGLSHNTTITLQQCIYRVSTLSSYACERGELVACTTTTQHTEVEMHTSVCNKIVNRYLQCPRTKLCCVIVQGSQRDWQSLLFLFVFPNRYFRCKQCEEVHMRQGRVVENQPSTQGCCTRDFSKPECVAMLPGW